MRFAATSRRWLILGGCLLLAGGIFAVGQRAIAQRADDAAAIHRQQDEDALAQRPQRPQGQFGQQGFPPGGGFGPGGPEAMRMMMMRGGGGPAMVANDKTVFILQGDQLLAFDANSLKLKAKAQVPHPTPPHGFGPGGPGRRGGPGRPGRPGAPKAK